MVSETRSGLGAITTHVNSTHVWQLGGATSGYGPGKPGLSLADYSGLVVGTLGRGPGALAMISDREPRRVPLPGGGGHPRVPSPPAPGPSAAIR